MNNLYFLNIDIPLIASNKKDITLRSLNIDLNINDIVYCRILYKQSYFAIIKIIDKQYIKNYKDLNYKTFKKIGYNKKEYLNMHYNLNNASNKRYLYKFKVISLNLNEYYKLNYF